MPAPRPRRPRVPYEGDVYIREPRRPRPIRARAQNLSASGIAITGAELPDEGAEVECRLHIGGMPRNLRGRVAWVRRTPPGQRTRPGAGIEFVGLAERDQALLSRVVEQADDGPQPVDVWVAGLDHPLRMRALVRNEELKLGFRIPRLVDGAAVRVRFVHRGVTEERSGTIAALKFTEGDGEAAARMVMQVATPRPDSGRGLLKVESAPTAEALASRVTPDQPSVVVDVAVLDAAAVAAEESTRLWTGSYTAVTDADVRHPDMPMPSSPGLTDAAPPTFVEAPRHTGWKLLGVAAALVVLSAGGASLYQCGARSAREAARLRAGPSSSVGPEAPPTRPGITIEPLAPRAPAPNEPAP